VARHERLLLLYDVTIVIRLSTQHTLTKGDFTTKENRKQPPCRTMQDGKIIAFRLIF